MSTTLAAPDASPASTGITGQTVATRVTSLDIFRGFTMAVMIFVNDLDDVRGLSRWTHHIPRDVNAMSYVDMVYPFFLFAVGLSLPLAIRQRLRRDPSLPRLWGHILLRCFALIVLGLIIANAGQVSRSLTQLRGSQWAALALLGAIPLWAVYPKSMRRPLVYTLRTAGAALLITMFAIFRRRLDDGHPAWINFTYPEILGLIGLTYVAVCLLYVPTRRVPWAPLAWFAALLLLNIATVAHWLPYLHPMYVFPFDNGAMPSITMAGIVISTIFFPEISANAPAETSGAKHSTIHPVVLTEAQRNGEIRSSARRQFTLALTFATLCALLGLALRPLGISKIRATPTWALWSIAAATAIFALFYFLCDLRRHTTWATLFRAPGSNTLLTYLLPDLTYYILAFCNLQLVLGHWNTGLPGLLRSLTFTLAMLLLSLALTRAKLRLQL